MKKSLLIKMQMLQKRYEEVESLLSDINIIEDQERFRTLSQEYVQLSNVTQCFRNWQQVQKDIKTVEILLNDLELHNMAQDELKLFREKSILLENQLLIFLLPKNSNDNYPCFIEIRAGTGGNEAAIFAGDLFRMYSRYAENNYWKLEIININESEQGGFKEIVVRIIGNGVYGRMKFESGGHRVQRIPKTESQGRIHTSTCTVAVLPDLPKDELKEINSNDLKIDTFRASGAGGQHVNTTDSAIRITHLPTGIVAECQDERSQHKNKAKALSVLNARIHAMEMAKRQAVEDSTRRQLLGSGDRSDRIRTYNFPQGRITDHRINLTIYCLNETLNGKLDILIDPIIQEYQTDQLATLSDGYDS